MLNIIGNVNRIIDKDNIMNELHPFMVYALLTAMVGMILYIIIGSWAVIQFSHNLLTLTKTAANTMKNVNRFSKLTINTSQQKMINRIARYNALFSLAAITSTTMVISTGILSIYFGVKGIPGGGPSVNNYWILSLLQIITLFDCLINIICLFLQYSFATDYYFRYCNKLDLCWKNIISRELKQELRQEFARIKEIKSVSQETEMVDESESDEMMELDANINQINHTLVQ